MDYYSIKSLLVLLGFLTAGSIFAWNSYKLLWENLRRGQSSGPFTNVGERIKGVFIYMAGQLKLFRVLIPGTAHFFIFWGFVFLSLTILQAILEGLFAFTNPHIIIPFLSTFGPLALIQDIFVLLVTLAVGIGLYNRIVVNPERYEGSHKSQAVMVLLFILTIMISLLVFNGSKINLGEDPIGQWRPISSFIGSLFIGLTSATQFVVGEAAFWIHIAVIFVFLTELPGGKHFHVVTSLPAIYTRNLAAKGRLPAAPEFNGDIGIREVERFQWRQMLDFYTCTECGRCQDVCPAYTSGLSLSPKLLMIELRENLMMRGEALRSSMDGDPSALVMQRDLVGDVITEEALWACVTCLACDQECPLFIEHVTPIVDMRRHLVIEGRMDEMLQDTLANLGRYGNSFGQSDRARAKWTREIEPTINDARKEPVEYLWFVGDYASYHSSCIDTTRCMAEVLQRAGIDFGIMYEGERNAGNDVRRVGEEGLFEMLEEDNLASLSRCSYQTIFTTDPHTYNTLKNEYRFNGNGHHQILHYSELLDQLINSGKLKFSNELGYRVTYHDPCYLGRYNDIYAAPRSVITATGCELVEMENNKDRAICCGAGGGRIWMEEGAVQQRPSEARIQEAMQIKGIQCFVVSCPKDMTMYKDAVKTTGVEDKIVVKDLIELIHEAMGEMV